MWKPSGSEARAGVLFVLPALTLIGVFFFLPVAAGLLLSLTDFDIYSLGNAEHTRFVGGGNYLELVRSQIFWKALWNTLYFSLVAGPLTILLALGTALLLNAKLGRFRTFFRTVYFAPVVTTLVAVAVVWRYLYHPRVGLINRFLGLFGIEQIDWLGDPAWAMPAIILLAIWKNFGYGAIIFLAGLQNAPEDLYEAARIDGAGPLRQFWHVTLPALAPTFVFVALITAIGYVQIFAEPYVMTPEGGPLNSTLTIVLLMYREGFRWWNMGFAAAIAFILFVLVVSGAVAMAFARRRLAK
ncbi:MAG: sugar ABC transporter permease [Acidobacteria bacterium]|nr:sugar ABC transporter permease [Acidobacteriota bacterium]